MPDQYRGYRHPFLVGTHYLGGVGDEPRTLVELAMCKFSSYIRSQSGWWLRYQDADERLKWAQEGLDQDWFVQTPSGHAQVGLSQRQIDYVLDELAGYATLRDSDIGCQVSCFERIWELDGVLNDSSTSDINSKLDALRSSQPRPVNNLIDPHCYPFVYEKTLVSFPRRPPRKVSPPQLSDIYTLSQLFCFLPTDTFVSTEGKAGFLSYINNLPPEHEALYALLEACVTRLVPLFQRCLTDLHRTNPLSRRISGHCRYTVWEEPESPEHSDDEEGWASYERNVRHWVMNRPLELPDVPGTGYTGGLEERRHYVDLHGKRLQFVVDAFDLRVTQDSPKVGDFPWRVEGMRNERIVACGYYIPRMDCVQPMSLHFRMAVTYPRGFNAGDSGATLRTWGLRDGDACHQHIGSVRLRTGFGLVFPNIYQHRPSDVQLEPGDAVEGRVRIVKFLLVDPDIEPRVSTSVVPPQQRSWIYQALAQSLEGRVPVEIVENVMEFVDEWVVDEGEAEETRREILEEREAFRVSNDTYHFCIPFDIWNGPEVLHE